LSTNAALRTERVWQGGIHRLVVCFQRLAVNQTTASRFL